jgi:hypothetical protein
MYRRGPERRVPGVSRVVNRASSPDGCSHQSNPSRALCRTCPRDLVRRRALSASSPSDWSPSRPRSRGSSSPPSRRRSEPGHPGGEPLSMPPYPRVRNPEKRDLAGLGMPLSVRKREYYENSAPDPGSCISRYFCGCGGRTGIFFVRTRHGAGQTPRPKDGENSWENLFSHRDLPSMTDYRVHHLVTDLRSR